MLHAREMMKCDTTMMHDRRQGPVPRHYLHQHCISYISGSVRSVQIVTWQEAVWLNRRIALRSTVEEAAGFVVVKSGLRQGQMKSMMMRRSLKTRRHDLAGSVVIRMK